MKLYINDLVRFIYKGGSNPGSTRLVYITEEGDTYFRGYDFTKEDLRTFSYDKVNDLTWPKDAKFINVENFPGELNDPEVWAEKYQKEGYKTFVTGNDVVAVKMPVLPKPRELRGYFHSNYFCFTKLNGNIGGVKLTTDGTVSLFESGKESIKNVTVEDLIKFLKE